MVWRVSCETAAGCLTEYLTTVATITSEAGNHSAQAQEWVNSPDQQQRSLQDLKWVWHTYDLRGAGEG